MAQVHHWYVEWCPYGTRTISSIDTCVRFDSQAERDHWVDVINRSMAEYVDGIARAMTRDEARKNYRLEDFDTEASHMTMLRTSAGEPVFEVRRRDREI